ncbi:hypothetical protein [Pantoea stewartii]|uniref:Repressor n=1 Tax=Pantoea stewartii subsp. stewartii DC283 TaxID=660596 RepID=A0ABM6K1F7_PANSE|nr:hypothetical protein [Pantoea stewartii]ARF48195.1 repressor [Pantoea stewartii subsp. stewartii DC283]KAB0557311.1 hypothetical protein F7Q90_07130 [Pantoea stewartii subsp. stewartii]
MLMSKAEYARYRGVSRQTVYDWVAKGAVVLSGSKIDVTATESQKNYPVPGGSEIKTWPHRTLEMTWGEFWSAVKANDGKIPAPASDDEIKQRVLDAADELNCEVQFLEDGGIWIGDGEAEHYFNVYGLRENAENAITMLRHEVCYAAEACGDDLDDWSEAGIRALSEWAKHPKEA